MRVTKDCFVEDTYFHIYNHTVENLLLFREDADYLNCLNRFKKKVSTYPASVFSYCLMPIHYHFFIRQDSEKPIYRIFNDVFAGYVQYYNRKYERKGVLFQNPLQHRILENNDYALKLSLYIHHNPIKAGLINSPEEWKYSNYLEATNKRNSILFSNDILNNNDISLEEYEKLMNEYKKSEIEKEIDEYLN
ncbi:MAG: hypothetical protein KAU01_10675 [Candidatus Cloacimonetes bacterium]|nr:hypothetical protein [Candidatus Cloacimonadota bacterium]